MRFKDESGQDIIEFALAGGFVAIMFLILYLGPKLISRVVPVLEGWATRHGDVICFALVFCGVVWLTLASRIKKHLF